MLGVFNLTPPSSESTSAHSTKVSSVAWSHNLKYPVTRSRLQASSLQSPAVVVGGGNVWTGMAVRGRTGRPSESGAEVLRGHTRASAGQ